MASAGTAVLSILALSSFLPALVFLAWFRSAGRGRKEQWSQLTMAFLFGAVAAIIIALLLEAIAAALLSHPIFREYEFLAADPSLFTFVMVVLVAPIAEESAKILGLFRMSRYMAQQRSGLVFGVAIGLGFAATENLLYEGAALSQGGVAMFLAVALVRSFSSALMHGCATSMSGYGVARKKFSRKSWLPYYLLAVFMHALFNLFASLGGLFGDDLSTAASMIGLLFAFALVLFSVKAVREKINSRALR